MLNQFISKVATPQQFSSFRTEENCDGESTVALAATKPASRTAMLRGGLLRAVSAVVSLGLCASLLTAMNPAYAATTLTVTDNSDTAGNAASGSLRQVLQYASTSCYGPFAPFTINFSIGAGGPSTILIGAALPTVSCAGTVIDGYTQLGSAANTLSSDWNAVLNVSLDGASCSGCAGLNIDTPAVNTLIKGINFTNWPKAVRIAANNAAIYGNYFFQGDIGISHEGGDGVLIGDDTVPSGRNIVVHTSMAGAGVRSVYTGGSPPQIRNNFIGLGAAAAVGLNTKGVEIAGINGASLANNVIANNTKGLVVGPTASGVIYSNGNKFFANGIAVDLNDDGLTANDPTDSETTGGNLLLNFPTITNVTPTSGTTADVSYQLTSSAIANFDVIFCRNPGGGSQCNLLVASTSVTTNGGGIATGTFSLAGLTAGMGITMATRATSGPKAGNMSEFSPAVLFSPGVCGNTEVTTTADSGLCSLRAAIAFANIPANCVVPPTITFALTGGGPYTIGLASPLPQITCNGLTIDGYSQSGATTNSGGSVLNNLANLQIILNGMSAAGAKGLDIAANNVTVKGLAIRSFPLEGILITGSNAVILGNYIGTDPGGMTAFGNSAAGIKVGGGSGTQIGDGTPAGVNLITANGVAGIQVQSGATAVSINGNMIGGKRNGGAGSSGGEGVDFAGGGNNSTVQANRIHGHAGSGVAVGVGVNAVKISQNRILFNTNKGITNLGNAGIQKPVISSVTIDNNASTTSVSGTYVALDNTLHKLEFFDNPVTPSVPSGEFFYNTHLVNPTGGGTFPFTASAGGIHKNISVTLRRDVPGDTSEFSDLYLTPISGTPTLVPFMTPATVNGSQAVTLTNISGAVLSFTSATVAGTGFTKTGDTCSGMMIASLGTCSVTVTFTLPTATTSTGSATFVVLAGGVTSTFINPLSGTTSAAPLTNVSVVPGGLNFGIIPVSQSASSQIVTVTNTGANNLAVTSIPLSGPSQSDYSISDTCIGNIIAPAGTCTVTIGFTALAAGARNAQFDVIANTAAATVVPLTAIGGLAPTISFAVAPTSIVAGGTSVGTLTISNPNAVSLTASAFTFNYLPGLVNAPAPNASSTCAGTTPTATPGAALSATSTGFTIPGSGSCTFSVTITSSIAAVYSGTISAGLIVTPAGSSNATPFNITVTAAPVTPAITSPASATGVVGNAFSYSITAANTPTSFNATSLPPGLSVNTSTGLISGTPTVAGTLAATISATNGAGTGTQGLSINIAPAPPPVPAITSPTTASGVTGTAFSYSITATNSPTSFGASGLPAGLGINTGTGLISGTPSVAGTFAATISATNISGTGTQALSITITAAPIAPIITSTAPPAGTVGTSYSHTIIASGTTPITWSVTTGTVPTGLTLNAATGILSGTPTAAGSFTFTVQAANGTLPNATQSNTIVIAAASAAPTITSAAPPAGTVGTAYSHTFIASGTTPITWSVTTGTVPTGLTLNAATGILSGTPTAAGSFTFTVQAANGTLPNATQSNTIVIAVASAAPTITSAAPPAGTVGTAYSHTFTASGTTPITWSTTNGTVPAGLNLNATSGILSGTPTAAGTFTFTLQAANGTLPNATQSNTIIINAATVAPTITSTAPASGTVGSSYSHTFSASGTTPITWSVAIGTVPTGLTLNATSGIVSGTPTAAGTFTFTLQAANGTLPNATQNITIIINAATLAPTITFALLPTSITTGGTTVGTVTISNSNANPLTANPFNFPYVPGLVNAANPNASSTCTGAAITATPGASSYSQTSSFTIPASGSCTFSSTVTTNTAGTYTGAVPAGLIVTSAGSSAASNSVTLIVTVAPAPAVTLAPTSVNFGARTVNTTSPATAVTLTNSGTGALTINSITGSGDFGFTSTCPIVNGQVAAGANCAINVTFTPLTVAALSGAISVASNASGSPHRIALSGSGTAAPVPGIFIAPDALTFAARTVNSTSPTQNVTVTNTGFANLALSSITVGAPFSRVALSATANPPDCSSSLAPGSTCQIGVAFTPIGTGLQRGSINITDNADGSPHTVALTGTGTLAPVAVISVTSPIAFGDQIINTASSTRNLTITNTGTATLTISAITLAGTNATNFTLSGQSACTSIAAAGSCSLTVGFNPSEAGAKTAQINITSNAQNAGTVNSVSLSGNGTLAPRPVLRLSLTTIGFGNTILGGATPSEFVTLTNGGGVPLNIANIAIAGDFAQTNNCGSSVAPLASCTINIMFTPAVPGAITGELIVTTDAPTNPDRVQLSGVGCRWFSQAQSRFFLTSCGN